MDHADIDHTGLTGISSGAVATDTLWDAAGDLAVGTGANTASKLPIGATGKVPTSDGTTLAYAYPPGYELDYVAITSNVTVAGTAEGTSTTIITGTSRAYPAEPIMIEFFTPRVDLAAVDAETVVILLYDGASVLGRMALAKAADQSGGSLTGTGFNPASGRVRLTPSAATHQYIIKAYSTSGTSTINAGAGGSGTNFPAFLRVTKV